MIREFLQNISAMDVLIKNVKPLASGKDLLKSLNRLSDVQLREEIAKGVSNVLIEYKAGWSRANFI